MDVLRPVGTEEFDRFARALDSPVFVVTTTDGTERSGCLVGFTTQTSIDPPRFLVCLSDKNHTLRVAAGAELLAVHRLGEDQHRLAEVFGGETGDTVDKFAAVGWHAGPGGVPVLDGCPAVFVGRILDRVVLGDHVGHLLEPVAVDVDDAGGPEGPEGPDREPLTLTDVEDVEPGHEA